jgi:hypothetical protein
LFAKVRTKGARDILGHVATDAALFLCHTTPVNDASPCGFRSRNAAHF